MADFIFNLVLRDFRKILDQIDEIENKISGVAVASQTLGKGGSTKESQAEIQALVSRLTKLIEAFSNASAMYEQMSSLFTRANKAMASGEKFSVTSKELAELKSKVEAARDELLSFINVADDLHEASRNKGVKTMSETLDKARASGAITKEQYDALNNSVISLSNNSTGLLQRMKEMAGVIGGVVDAIDTARVNEAKYGESIDKTTESVKKLEKAESERKTKKNVDTKTTEASADSKAEEQGQDKVEKATEKVVKANKRKKEAQTEVNKAIKEEIDLSSKAESKKVTDKKVTSIVPEDTKAEDAHKAALADIAAEQEEINTKKQQTKKAEEDVVNIAQKETAVTDKNADAEEKKTRATKRTAEATKETQAAQESTTSKAEEQTAATEKQAAAEEKTAASSKKSADAAKEKVASQKASGEAAEKTAQQTQAELIATGKLKQADLDRLRAIADAANQAAARLQIAAKEEKSRSKLREIEQQVTEELRKQIGLRVKGTTPIVSSVMMPAGQAQKTILGNTEQYKDAFKALQNVGEALETVDKKINGMPPPPPILPPGTNGELRDFNKNMEIAVGKIIRYRASFYALQAAIQGVKAAFKEFIDMQTELAKIEQVIDPATSSVAQLGQEAVNMSKEFGISILEITKAYKIWAQMGIAQNDIINATRASLLGVNTTGLDSKQVVEALTSALFTYKMNASELVTVIDKWAKVQAGFPVEAEDLVGALRTIGSSAKEAGVSLDELNGIVTAINAVTRKPGTAIGNSLKTMFARIPREETISMLDSIGVNVKKTTDSYNALFPVLGQLAGKWESLTDVQRMNIAVAIGGVRHYVDFLALMQNFDVAAKATAESQLSAGDALKKQGIIIDTLQKQWDVAKASAEEFALALGQRLGPVVKSSTGFILTLTQTLSSAAWTKIIYLLLKLISVFTLAKGASFMLSLANKELIGSFKDTYKAILMNRAATLGLLATEETKKLFMEKTMAEMKTTIALTEGVTVATLNWSLAIKSLLRTLGPLIVVWVALGYIMEKFMDSSEEYAATNLGSVIPSLEQEANIIQSTIKGYQTQNAELSRLSKKRSELVAVIRGGQKNIEETKKAEEELVKTDRSLVSLMPSLTYAVEKYGDSMKDLTPAINQAIMKTEDLIKMEEGLLKQKAINFINIDYPALQENTDKLRGFFSVWAEAYNDFGKLLDEEGVREKMGKAIEGALANPLKIAKSAPTIFAEGIIENLIPSKEEFKKQYSKIGVTEEDITSMTKEYEAAYKKFYETLKQALLKKERKEGVLTLFNAKTVFDDTNVKAGFAEIYKMFERNLTQTSDKMTQADATKKMFESYLQTGNIKDLIAESVSDVEEGVDLYNAKLDTSISKFEADAIKILQPGRLQKLIDEYLQTEEGKGAIDANLKAKKDAYTKLRSESLQWAKSLEDEIKETEIAISMGKELAKTLTLGSDSAKKNSEKINELTAKKAQLINIQEKYTEEVNKTSGESYENLVYIDSELFKMEQKRYDVQADYKKSVDDANRSLQDSLSVMQKQFSANSSILDLLKSNQQYRRESVITSKELLNIELQKALALYEQKFPLEDLIKKQKELQSLQNKMDVGGGLSAEDQKRFTELRDQIKEMTNGRLEYVSKAMRDYVDKSVDLFKEINNMKFENLIERFKFLVSLTESVKSSLENIFAKTLGSFPDLLEEGAEKRKALMDDIKSTEEELSNAQQERDYAAADAAQKRLSDLKKELNESKQGWYEIKNMLQNMFKDIGRLYTDTIAKELANSLANISLGKNTLAEQIAFSFVDSGMEVADRIKVGMIAAEEKFILELRTLFTEVLSKAETLVNPPIMPIPGEQSVLPQQTRFNNINTNSKPILTGISISEETPKLGAKKPGDELTEGASQAKQLLIESGMLFASYVGQSIGTNLGGGTPGAAQGASVGSGIGTMAGTIAGSFLGAPQLGAMVGNFFGGIVGGLLGKEDEQQKTYSQVVRANTEAIKANTSALEQLSSQIFNAPTRFALVNYGGGYPRGGAFSGNVNFYINGGDIEKTKQEIINVLDKQLNISIKTSRQKSYVFGS